MKSSNHTISGFGVATLIFLVLTSGCSQRVKVISSDLMVIRMPAGKPYVAPVDGFFVSDRWMLEDITQLSEEVKRKEGLLKKPSQ